MGSAPATTFGARVASSSSGVAVSGAGSAVTGNAVSVDAAIPTCGDASSTAAGTDTRIAAPDTDVDDVDVRVPVAPADGDSVASMMPRRNVPPLCCVSSRSVIEPSADHVAFVVWFMPHTPMSKSSVAAVSPVAACDVPEPVSVVVPAVSLPSVSEMAIVAQA